MYEKSTERSYGYEKMLVLICNPLFKTLNIEFPIVSPTGIQNLVFRLQEFI
jgi:hypothetical protein